METSMTTSTDRIEKTIDLKASRARVWKAISDSKEFGTWFEVAIDGPFEAGRDVQAKITSAGEHEGFGFVMKIDRVEPETLLSYRWHPYSKQRGVDLANEPMTLVEFRLATIPTGTRLTIVESGFDRLPAGRRAEAFPRNDHGWSIQIERVAKHVGG
jgi:uncharacterized protein YndB with AHSA1/START domain